jgi:cell cycle checkpoint protein
MAGAPIFTAVSTSARQLYLLLRCINFVTKVEVHITAEGLRFSAEESHVIQGLAFLEKTLFSSYIFNPPNGSTPTQVPPFQVSLSALIETLQIFGIAEVSSSHRNPNGGFTSSYSAFNNPALALGGTCRISYHEVGAPLSITISESGVTTTCELTTYDAPPHYDEDDGIPLDRNALALKIIMGSTWLHDAIGELSGTNPTVLVLNASSISRPYLALEGRGGPFGDSTVEFQPDSKNDPMSGSARGKKQPLITETFSVSPHTGDQGRVKQRYKFDLIKKAGKAMALASKVSLRQDVQGVLSLQFMIEVGETGVGGSREGQSNGAMPSSTNGGRTSFVDFRFLPLVDEDNEDEGDDGEDTQDRDESTASED